VAETTNPIAQIRTIAGISTAQIPDQSWRNSQIINATKIAVTTTCAQKNGSSRVSFKRRRVLSTETVQVRPSGDATCWEAVAIRAS
jgi:hypothetical protein